MDREAWHEDREAWHAAVSMQRVSCKESDMTEQPNNTNRPVSSFVFPVSQNKNKKKIIAYIVCLENFNVFHSHCKTKIYIYIYIYIYICI